MTTARTRKSTTKETAEKAPAKKAAAKKTAAKKTAKKSAKKTADKSADTSANSTGPRKRASAPRAESKPKRSAMDVAERALEQLAGLTGRSAEGITGIERRDEGWRVSVEVVEVRRVPETTDVLAQYEVDTDDDGELTGYRRTDRYTRGSTRED